MNQKKNKEVLHYFDIPINQLLIELNLQLETYIENKRLFPILKQFEKKLIKIYKKEKFVKSHCGLYLYLPFRNAKHSCYFYCQSSSTFSECKSCSFNINNKEKYWYSFKEHIIEYNNKSRIPNTIKVRIVEFMIDRIIDEIQERLSNISKIYFILKSIKDKNIFELIIFQYFKRKYEKIKGNYLKFTIY